MVTISLRICADKNGQIWGSGIWRGFPSFYPTFDLQAWRAGCITIRDLVCRHRGFVGQIRTNGRCWALTLSLVTCFTLWHQGPAMAFFWVQKRCSEKKRDCSRQVVPAITGVTHQWSYSNRGSSISSLDFWPSQSPSTVFNISTVAQVTSSPGLRSGSNTRIW